MEHDGNNTLDVIIEKLLLGNLKSIPVSSLYDFLLDYFILCFISIFDTFKLPLLIELRCILFQYVR